MRPTFIDLNPDESPYHPLMIYWDICYGSGDILDGLSTISLCGVYAPNKTEDVNFKVFTMISRINELKLLKHISRDCGCRFTVKIVI